MKNSPGIPKMVKAMAALQGNMTKIQKEVESAVFEGQAAGGLLKVSINGKGEGKEVAINPELLKETPELVADIIVAAINDAHRKKEAFSKEKLKGIAGGLLPVGLNIPGL